MKKGMTVLLGALLIAGVFGPVGLSKAAGVVVEVGDRPYYTRGAFYVENGVRWVWVPGHWARHSHVWVHGHYVRR